MIGQTKKILLTVLIATLVLTPIAFVSLIYWMVATASTEGSDWLVTKHFDPSSAGFLMSVQDDSWAVTLATPEFATLSEKERLALAKDTFNGVWSMAEGYGYVKSELEQWFMDTAKNFSSYPIKKAKLMNNSFMTFREFTSGSIPKPNILATVLKMFTSNSVSAILPIFLWVAIPAIVLLFLLVGVASVFLTKELPVLYKIIVAGLIVAMVFEGWLIKVVSSKKIIPSGFFNVFTFGDNYVSATGTWRGVNQKIAYPVNAAKIECFKDQRICREANAELADSALMVNTTEWQITSWDDKEITIDHQSKCNTTKMVINFKDKAVTQIRTPIDPQPEDCMAGKEGKFITEMVDGFEAIYGKKFGVKK
ncbi:MAG: hypothetical protein A3J52_00715 [Omnitrophica bacterium RIFCSPHIGHO2_02_FULL_49_9]|nr:MAG: hypothetical protein A3J52_00715 [Omnitrophica bacterium RIFCSPHIGHO2_02_FULL_49_9]